MPFLNKLENSDFISIYKKLRPRSYYGKHKKDNFSPFTRDKLQQAKRYYEKLSFVINWERENKADAKYIRSKLSKIENIDNNLNNLVDYNLDNVNFYEVRKFILNANLILEKLEQVKFNKFITPYDNELRCLKEIFSKYCDLESGFNISNSKFNKLYEVNKEILKDNLKISKVKGTRRALVSKILNKEVDGRFLVEKDDLLVEELNNLDFIHISQKDESYYVFDFLEDKTILDLKRVKNQKKKKYLDLQDDIKIKLLREIISYFDILRKIAKSLGSFDLLLAKSEFFQIKKMCLPKLIDYPEVIIQSGYHPVLEEKLKTKSQTFTPRSININKGVVALTGINMGGKTVTLRMISLFGILVSYGMPIPAKECQFPLFDLIYFNNKFNDTIDSGLSLFGKELKSIQFALNNKNKFGLILIDEIASGANPEVGKFLTHAFIEEMIGSNSIVIITTHYSGINNYDSIQRWKTKGVKEEIESLNELNIDNISKFIDYSLVKSVEDYTSEDILRVVEILGVNENLIVKTKDKLVESRCE